MPYICYARLGETCKGTDTASWRATPNRCTSPRRRGRHAVRCNRSTVLNQCAIRFQLTFFGSTISKSLILKI